MYAVSLPWAMSMGIELARLVDHTRAEGNKRGHSVGKGMVNRGQGQGQRGGIRGWSSTSSPSCSCAVWRALTKCESHSGDPYPKRIAISIAEGKQGPC